MIIRPLRLGIAEGVEALGELQCEAFGGGADVLFGVHGDFGDLARYFPGADQIPRCTREHDRQNGQRQRQRGAVVGYRAHS